MEVEENHDKLRDKLLSSGCLRDAYGFEVKREFEALHKRFSPLWQAEEAERSALWAAFFEGQGVEPEHGEDAEEVLKRILTECSSAEAQPTPEAAACLQQLRALVQAGVPMASRGRYWRLFLGVGAKRQPGLYEELVQLALAEAPSAGHEKGPAAAELAGSGGGRGASPRKPLKQHGSGGLESLGLPVVEVHADGSAQGALAAARAAAGAAGDPNAAQRVQHAQQQQHATFTVTSDSIQPLEPEGGAAGISAGETAGAAAAAPAPGVAVAESPVPGTPAVAAASNAAAAAAATDGAGAEGPADGLTTPISSGSGSAGRSPEGSVGSSSAGSVGPPSSGGSWQARDWLSQIEKDLHRTFPGHPLMDASGRAVLRRILAAYARHNPSVGYCQGLNFIAACFMLFMGEEDAFWCLAAVVEDLLPGYFHMRMVAPQVDQQVYRHLLQGGFPTVWAHLQALEVDVSSVTMHWFLCMYINSLPLESCLRVWDMLFFEGSPVVLFRVALALVDVYQKALLECRECSDAYMLLQSMGPMSFDSSRLLDTACSGYCHIRDSALRVLRSKYRPAVLDAMRDSFSSDEELSAYSSYLTSEGPPHSRSQCLADAFARAARAEVAAELLAGDGPSPGPGPAEGGAAAVADDGHLSASSAAGGTPGGPEAGASTADSRGERPVSPLGRLLTGSKQAAAKVSSAITARLVPSSLPPVLPAGALDARGEERPCEAQAASPGATTTGSGSGGLLASLGSSLAEVSARRRSRREGRRASGATAADAEQQDQEQQAQQQQHSPAGGEPAPSSEAAQAAAAGAAAAPTPWASRLLSLHRLRAGSGAGQESPTSQQSGSAASGAALGRGGQGSTLTPFSDPTAVLSGEEGGGSCTPLSKQPQQGEPGSAAPGEDESAEPQAAAQTLPRGAPPAQPAPSSEAAALDILDFRSPLRPCAVPHHHHQQHHSGRQGRGGRSPSSQPAATGERTGARLHRRTLSALPLGTASQPRRAAPRRRRSFLPDLHRLAAFVPDFRQPAVAAAYQIASHPSPRHPRRRPGDGDAGDGSASSSTQASPERVYSRTPLSQVLGGSGGSRRGSAGGGGATAAADVAAAAAGAGGGSGVAAGEEEEESSPVRMLRFGTDEEEGAVQDAAAAGRDQIGGGGAAAIAAGDAAGPAAGADGALDERLPLRRYTEGDAGLGDSTPWHSLSFEVADGQAAGPSPMHSHSRSAPGEVQSPPQSPKQLARDAAVEDGGDSSEPPSGAVAAAPGSAGGSPTLGLVTPAHVQRQPPSTPTTSTQLLAVVEQLQEEVATAESRRHAAEGAARHAVDTSQQLHRQLGKLHKEVEHKEALLADLGRQVGVVSGEVCELEGELCASRMAAQALQRQVDQRQQQLAEKDEYIRLLMDKAAQ